MMPLTEEDLSFSSVPVFFQCPDGRLEGTLQIPRALLQDADYFAASLSGRCHCQEGDGGSRVSCVVLDDMTWDECLCLDLRGMHVCGSVVHHARCGFVTFIKR